MRFNSHLHPIGIFHAFSVVSLFYQHYWRVNIAHNRRYHSNYCYFCNIIYSVIIECNTRCKIITIVTFPLLDVNNEHPLLIMYIIYPILCNICIYTYITHYIPLFSIIFHYIQYITMNCNLQYFVNHPIVDTSQYLLVFVWGVVN